MEKSGAMARLLIVGLLLLKLLSASALAHAQDVAAPSITSPGNGEYLGGKVQVKGTTQIPGFASSELDFGYAGDPTGTWFVIQTASLPGTNDTLGVWDTTLITDGDYSLRLRVMLQDGSSKDSVVTVRVRNYTPLPTATPAVTATQPPVLDIPTAIIIVASETATATMPPPIYTPTSLPPNPASVAPSAIYSGFWRGALLVGVLIVLVGALVRIRR